MRVRLVFRPTPTLSPLTQWVHQPRANGPDRAQAFDPPLPPKSIGQGYPLWVVEHRGREIYFASPEEIAHAIDVLGVKILPSPRVLGESRHAVNAHWLSRLHRSWKPWNVREELVRRLRAASVGSLKNSKRPS